MASCTRNIIEASLGDDPLVIRNSIETVIRDKIAEALDARKNIIAKNLIGVDEQHSFYGDKKNPIPDDKNDKDGSTKHPYYGGKSAHSKPPYQTSISKGKGKTEEIEIDMDDFKAFLSDELQMDIDDGELEFLLEDIDDQTLEEIITDYQTLNEIKKK